MARRAGFTLVEVLIALSMLAVLFLGMTAVTGQLLHTVATSDRQAAALELVQDRIEEARLHPDYTTLDSAFAGTESGFATLPGFTRTTTVARSGSGSDFTRITVEVNGPGLLRPVVRTVTVGAP